MTEWRSVCAQNILLYEDSRSSRRLLFQEVRGLSGLCQTRSSSPPDNREPSQSLLPLSQTHLYSERKYRENQVSTASSWQREYEDAHTHLVVIQRRVVTQGTDRGHFHQPFILTAAYHYTVLIPETETKRGWDGLEEDCKYKIQNWT